MPPGIQALANQHPGLTGYNPYGPSCSPGEQSISHEEAINGQWSFFVCRNGTIDCQLSQHVYIGELKATCAAVSRPEGFYAINIAPLHQLVGMMRGPDTAGRNQDTVE